LKARRLNGAIWRYLKRCFGNWNCLENVETKEAKWCNMALFKTVFGSWNCLENYESKEAKWCILVLSKTMFWKLELLRKC